MRPVSSANFCHFPITSCSGEKRYLLFRTESDGKLGGAWERGCWSVFGNHVRGLIPTLEGEDVTVVPPLSLR